MSTAVLTPSASTAMPPPPRHPDVVVGDEVVIPGWVCDHASYRRWAVSDDYPESGWISYLDGAINVDLSMEEFITHNQVKYAFNGSIFTVLTLNPTGRYVPDRMLYSNTIAGLTTEPDGLYAHWRTLQSGQLRLIAGKKAGYVELEGTPDMVLEIVSQTSQKKDTVTLRELYARARIPEYWLVDARSEPCRFEILELTNGEYQSVPSENGWIRSKVFGMFFQLVREIDPLGQPLFVVKVKSF